MSRKKRGLLWTKKLKEKILEHPFIIILGILYLIISQVYFLGSVGREAISYFNKPPTLSEEEQEETNINTLSAGMNIVKFKDVLGNPLFIAEGRKSDLIEYTFKSNFSFIQAITDKNGTVDLYTITICSDSFKPKIQYNPIHTEVIIGESTFKDVAGDNTPVTHYAISGATSNSRLIERIYLGNSSNYQTVFYGWNDICSLRFDTQKYSELYEKTLPSNLPIDLEDPLIEELRSTVPINTFGVTSIFVWDEKVEQIFEDFQIGVDRIKIRTLPENNQ